MSAKVSKKSCNLIVNEIIKKELCNCAKANSVRFKGNEAFPERLKIMMELQKDLKFKVCITRF